MADKIEAVEGIGPKYGQVLGKHGIATTADLLKHAATPDGRKNLAEKTGIGDKLILKWANLADLMRINGVGTQYAELLEAAGVDTVKELRTRRADNLTTKLAEVKDAKKLTRKSPTQGEVQKWIEEAAKLPPAIMY